jgi:hypothetical protein
VQTPLVLPLPPRRSSSCPPPGAMPVVSPGVFTHADLSGAACSETRDDLAARRPSSTTMYQSISSFHASFPSPDLASAGQYTFPWVSAEPAHPPLTTGPYRMGTPGWRAPDPDPWEAQSNWTGSVLDVCTICIDPSYT